MTHSTSLPVLSSLSYQPPESPTSYRLLMFPIVLQSWEKLLELTKKHMAHLSLALVDGFWTPYSLPLVFYVQAVSLATYVNTVLPETTSWNGDMNTKK